MTKSMSAGEVTSAEFSGNEWAKFCQRHIAIDRNASTWYGNPFNELKAGPSVPRLVLEFGRVR